MVTARNLFDALPTEIWAKIIRVMLFHAPLPPPRAGHSCHSKPLRLKDVVALGRTCRTVHDHALRALWHHLDIADDRTLQRVLGAVELGLLGSTGTTLGSLVYHLDLPRVIDWQDLHNILLATPNVRILHAWRPSAVPVGRRTLAFSTVGGLGNLTDLGFCEGLRAPHFTAADLAAISQDLPNLKTLSVPKLDALGVEHSAPSNSVRFSFPSLVTLRLGSRKQHPASTLQERRPLRLLVQSLAETAAFPRLRELYVFEDLGDVAALVKSCGRDLAVCAFYTDCREWGFICPKVHTVLLAADHAVASLPTSHPALQHLYVRSWPQYVMWGAANIERRPLGGLLDEIMHRDFPSLHSVTFCGGYWSGEDVSTSAKWEMDRRGIKLVFPDECKYFFRLLWA